MTVPLVSHGGRLGALSFGYVSTIDGEDERRHGERDLALAEEFAERAAVAIDNARLYHEAQAALLEANEALGLRDQFLSVASHELRTPLTALKGQIQLAQRRLSQGQVERVGTLIDHADVQVGRLTRLVRDLLDVSRIAAGGLPIEREPVALGALLRRVTELERATVPGRTFELEIPATVPVIAADGERLEQVLINLMENARKYSSAPSPIHIRLSVADDAISIAVSDRGVGVPAEDQDRIFERFHRAGNVDRNIAGLGLGLYIAGEIVRAHGGGLSVQSVPGEGSTFTVTLPRGEAAM
jgi:signal transduction histidine kinase